MRPETNINHCGRCLTLTLILWCFSALKNYNSEISLNLKEVLYVRKRETLQLFNIAPTTKRIKFTQRHSLCNLTLAVASLRSECKMWERG